MKNYTCSEMIDHLVILKSKFFIAIIFSLFVFKVNGQVANYTFTQTSGIYQEVTGGSTTTATSSGYSVAGLNDVVVTYGIPFAFNYDGVGYTTVGISSNGFMTFGTVAPTVTNYKPLSDLSTSYSGAVSPWGQDLNGFSGIGGKTSQMTVGILGAAPNRTVVFQWKDFRPYRSTSTTQVPYINFQVRLHETSNRIEVIYGDSGYVAGSTGVVQGVEVGLRGPNNTFATNINNRANATNVLFGNSTQGTTNASVQNFNTITSPPGMPVSGLTYTWTFPCPTYSAVISVGGTVTTRGSLYSSITAALADLSRCLISQPTTLLLNTNYNSAVEVFPITIPNIPGSNIDNTITIKPDAGVTKTISGSNANAIIKLNGADNIIIDGSNIVGGDTKNLSIVNTNSAANSNVWFASTAIDGSTNNILKNTIVTGGNATTNGANVIISGSTIGGAAEFSNNNITIHNNTFSNSQNAVFAVGNGTTLDENWVISNNIISNMGFRGIEVQNATAFNIGKNTISGVSQNTSSTISGIFVGAQVANGVIANNKISNIKNTNTVGYGANGIYLNSVSTNANITVYNNMIWDVAGYGYAGALAEDNGYGMAIASGGGYKLYYNSINMNTNQNRATGISAAINITNGVTTNNAVDLRNNIFANNQTTGTRYAIYAGGLNNVFSNVDYNDYYSTQNLGFLGSARATVNDWRTATGKDANSISILPPYISPTDLHLVECAGMNFPATPIAAVTVDIDGDLRSATAPNMGADELIKSTAATTFTSSLSEIGCGINPTNITLSTSGGTVSSAGVSTLFYEGNICPVVTYGNEFLNVPITSSSVVGNLSNGIRTFTATTADPMIHLENVLTSAISDPAKTKFIVIRYKVTTNPGVGNEFQIYFKKNTLNLDESRVVKQLINTDGNWHIATIDMSANTQWNNTDGNITGWRFDYASLSGTVIDLDYIILSDTPILENTNADDASIVVAPSTLAASAQYGTFRISECASQVIGCSTTLNTTITNLDRVFDHNTAWDVASNWRQGLVPTANNCVIIPSARTVDINVPNAAAKSVTVQNGAKLNINANQSLTVQDAFINQSAVEDVTIRSDGNLLQINPSKTINFGNITVQREVNGMNNLATHMDYVYWSSPVANQQTKGLSGFSPGTPVAFFSDYNEPNDMFYETLDPTFIAGKGYAVQAEGLPLVNGYAKTYTFAGAPHNGDFSFNISRSPDQGGYQHGYNLVGNPYPSNIDFTKLFAANSDLIYNTAYFWTNNTFTPNQAGSGYAGNNYAVFNGAGGNPPTGSSYGAAPNGIIKVGQGFIIQKKTPGGPAPLLFKNSYGTGQDLRVSTAGTFYQKDAAGKDRYWLQLISPNHLSNTQLIAYVNGATNGFEQDYDAEILGMSSDVFYSVLTDKKLIIQGKGLFASTDKVNVGANIFSNGSYTIKLDHVEGIFANGQNIYLKDNQTGIITNLSLGSYTFAANAGETNARFQIIYQPETVLATDDTSKDKLVVYRENDDFVIKSPKVMERVEVYETSGKLIKVLLPNSKSTVLESATLINGMYILKIKTKDGEIFNKKVLR